MTAAHLGPVLRFAPFTANDWFAFSGAEAFDDNEEPLLATFTVLADGASVKMLAVLDATGLVVEREEEALYQEPVVYVGYPRASRVALLLRDGMAEADLRALCGSGCL